MTALGSEPAHASENCKRKQKMRKKRKFASDSIPGKFRTLHRATHYVQQNLARFKTL